MKINRLLFLTFAFLLSTVPALKAQEVSPEKLLSFLGMSVSSPDVKQFFETQGIDQATGLSYEKGIQIFHDGTRVTDIFLFNSATLNGQVVKAYSGKIPYALTFTETTESLKKKIGSNSSERGEHLVWTVNKIMIEAAFKDDKKTELTFVSFSVSE